MYFLFAPIFLTSICSFFSPLSRSLSHPKVEMLSWHPGGNGECNLLMYQPIVTGIKIALWLACSLLWWFEGRRPLTCVHINAWTCNLASNQWNKEETSHRPEFAHSGAPCFRDVRLRFIVLFCLPTTSNLLFIRFVLVSVCASMFVCGFTCECVWSCRGAWCPAPKCVVSLPCRVGGCRETPYVCFPPLSSKFLSTHLVALS